MDAAPWPQATAIARAVDRLLRERDYLSEATLGAAVVGELQAGGCELEWHPQRGVRLLETGLGVWADYLRWRDGRRPRMIEVYGSAASTQDVVRRLLDGHGVRADGAVAVADFQHAGRGRLGRRWVAPPGSAVLFSRGCFWPDATAAPTCDQLMLATSVGLCRGLDEVAGGRQLDVRIRWPNDLMIGAGKLAGILVEQFNLAAGAAAVIGVGVNVRLDPADLPAELAGPHAHIASLSSCGVGVDRLSVLAALVAALDRALDRVDDPQLVDEWRRRSVLLGRRVTLVHDGRRIEGDVLDLSPRDGLIVRTRNGALTHLPAATTSLVPD